MYWNYIWNGKFRSEERLSFGVVHGPETALKRVLRVEMTLAE